MTGFFTDLAGRVDDTTLQLSLGLNALLLAAIGVMARVIHKDQQTQITNTRADAQTLVGTVTSATEAVARLEAAIDSLREAVARGDAEQGRLYLEQLHAAEQRLTRLLSEVER